MNTVIEISENDFKKMLKKAGQEKSFSIENDLAAKITEVIFVIKNEKEETKEKNLLINISRIRRRGNIKNTKSLVFNEINLWTASTLILIKCFLEENNQEKDILTRIVNRRLKNEGYLFPYFQQFGIEVAFRNLQKKTSSPDWLKDFANNISEHELLVAREHLKNSYLFK